MFLHFSFVETKRFNSFSNVFPSKSRSVSIILFEWKILLFIFCRFKFLAQIRLTNWNFLVIQQNDKKISHFGRHVAKFLLLIALKLSFEHFKPLNKQKFVRKQIEIFSLKHCYKTIKLLSKLIKRVPKKFLRN